jgi:hypothetical protein
MVFALAGVIQQTHNIEQGRFSAAGGTHYGTEFAGLNFEVHVIKCRGFYIFGDVNLFKVFSINHDVFGLLMVSFKKFVRNNGTRIKQI